MNLNYIVTFPLELIKCAKLIFNQKIKFSRDMKRHIHTIAIKNGWNTQIIQILYEECDGKFQFYGNLLSRLPNPVELSHKWVLKICKYQEPSFDARLFYGSEEGLFGFPIG